MVNDESLQKWEGAVYELGYETFYARLWPIEGPEKGELMADIYYDSARTSKEKLSVGDLFHWTIDDTGSSHFDFNPYPPFTKKQIAAAIEQAANMRILVNS